MEARNLNIYLEWNQSHVSCKIYSNCVVGMLVSHKSSNCFPVSLQKWFACQIHRVERSTFMKIFSNSNICSFNYRCKFSTLIFEWNIHLCIDFTYNMNWKWSVVFLPFLILSFGCFFSIMLLFVYFHFFRIPFICYVLIVWICSYTIHFYCFKTNPTMMLFSRMDL